jgi:hypothetical protein
MGFMPWLRVSRVVDEICSRHRFFHVDVDAREARPRPTAIAPPAGERSPSQAGLIAVGSVVRVKRRFSAGNELLRTRVVALPRAANAMVLALTQVAEPAVVVGTSRARV